MRLERISRLHFSRRLGSLRNNARAISTPFYAAAEQLTKMVASPPRGSARFPGASSSRLPLLLGDSRRFSCGDSAVTGCCVFYASAEDLLQLKISVCAIAIEVEQLASLLLGGTL